MSGSKKVAGSVQSRRTRVIKVLPVTRAVRVALGVSIAALALGGSGAAFAGTCTAPVSNTIHCNGTFVDTITYPDVDLTLVVGDSAPTSVTPAAGAAGIQADWPGMVNVTSFADIATDGADGIYASGSTSAQVVNSGNISTNVTTDGAMALDVSAAGDVHVVNDGSILAYSTGVYDVTAVRAESTGTGYAVTVDNQAAGTIGANAYMGSAIGIYGYATSGDVNINNAGAITASSDIGLADGIFASGVAVDVANTGTLDATGYNWAAGIEAQGSDLATVSNDGTINATVTGYGNAFGVYATGGTAGVGVDNSGSITAAGAFAYGIYATAGGGIAISNTGDIAVGDAYGSYYATGIHASNNYSTSDIAVDNSGTLMVGSYYKSTGIEVVATGAGSSGSVSNTGSVSVDTTANYSATGLVVSADADATIDNAGSVTIGGVADGVGYGAIALAFNGDANVINSGDINVASVSSSYGIVSASQNGLSVVDNSGLVSVVAGYLGYGIQASSLAGTTVVNTGMIGVDAIYAFGILATAGDADVVISNGAAGVVIAYSQPNIAYAIAGVSTVGDVSVENAGSVYANAAYAGVGALARARNGNATVDNSGDITAYSYRATAIGAFAKANVGIATVNNSGSIAAYSPYGNAIGIYAAGVDGGVVTVTNSGDVTASAAPYAPGYTGAARGIVAVGDAVDINNSGTITATSGYGSSAFGIYGYATAGDVSIGNAGDITATSDAAGGMAIGAVVLGAGDLHLTNTGSISAVATQADGTAIGVLAQSNGTVLIDNAGTITATDTYAAYAVAVSLNAAVASTLRNTGTITTNSALEGNIAILGSYGVENVLNYGNLHGAVIVGGGDDLLVNASGGVWTIDNHSTDFGDGDDTISNRSGGTIHLTNGAIYLGSSASAGNAFTNAGTIKVSGDDLIDMGSGLVALVPSLNSLPLTNNGVIDFIDGSPDDILIVNGDLAGSGQINLDLGLLSGASDTLYVDGSIAAGTAQTVNVAFDGVPPTQATTPIPFAYITGNSSAGSFVGGNVIGYTPGNFLDLQVNVSSQLDASNAGNDVFSVGVEVAGLNDTGALAASIASGAHSLINSQVGTWRQRMGVLPRKNADTVGLSPWIRVFSDKGGVDPTHFAGNFGQSGNFRYDQSNSGRELGMNINVRSGFNLGVLLTKSAGTQRLINAGVGSDRLHASAFGLYSTWISPQGFYVDASYRWISFDADLLSVAGAQTARGDANAFNLEAGYTAWNVPGGVSVEPQIQYTRSTVGNIDTLRGDRVDFVAEGGSSTRGRLGVAFSKTIEGASFVLTPYGSVNAVREFDGQSTYLVGDRFTGSTSIAGTSALIELGLGMQKAGLSITGGVDWTDGGAMRNFVGGQMVLRYAW